jgi:hypothetical protein
MPTTTDIGRVRERSTGTYTATLQDEAEVVIPSASLTTLTLSVYDVRTGTVLNNRNNQNVLNANNVTVHATSGLLTWSVQSADNAMVSTRSVESHIAVFEYTWASGAKRDWHRLSMLIEAEPEVS